MLKNKIFVFVSKVLFINNLRRPISSNFASYKKKCSFFPPTRDMSKILTIYYCDLPLLSSPQSGLKFRYIQTKTGGFNHGFNKTEKKVHTFFTLLLPASCLVNKSANLPKPQF